jgi:hypothetical protein
MAAPIEHALFRRASAARHIRHIRHIRQDGRTGVPQDGLDLAWLTRGRTAGITWHGKTLRLTTPETTKHQRSKIISKVADPRSATWRESVMRMIAPGCRASRKERPRGF